jgi:hypothetical protein
MPPLACLLDAALITLQVDCNAAPAPPPALLSPASCRLYRTMTQFFPTPILMLPLLLLLFALIFAPSSLSLADEIIDCAAGSYNPDSASGSAGGCKLCPANSYCSRASVRPTPCPIGTSSDAGCQSIHGCRRMPPFVHSCSWSQAALSTARSAAAAASLPPRDAYTSGLLLFAGGSDATTGSCSAAVDIFNPESKTWTTALLSSARCYVAAAVLPLQVQQRYTPSQHRRR